MYSYQGAADWLELPLFDLAVWRNGLAFKNIDFSATGKPIIKIAELKSGITVQTARTDASYDVSVHVGVGDMLFSWSGNPDTSIDVFRWRGEDGWLNQHIFRVTAAENVLPDFLFLLLRSLRPRFAEIARNKQTTGLGHVTVRDLKDIKVGVPTMDEQASITAVLMPLENKIELNRRMNETLEASARALFRDWFVDFGPSRAKAEGRPAYLAPHLWSLFPDRLGGDGVPEGWEQRKVSKFAELKGGKQLEKDKISETGDMPVFGGAGIMGYTDAFNSEGYVISVGRVGAYCGQFFAHRGRAWINNNASYVRLRRPRLAEWLFMALKEVDMDVIKKGAAQPFVSNTDIANLDLIWPGEKVIEAFASILGPLVRQMEAHADESRTLAATRGVLLPKLMSGEIRVRDAEALAA